MVQLWRKMSLFWSAGFGTPCLGLSPLFRPSLIETRLNRGYLNSSCFVYCWIWTGVGKSTWINAFANYLCFGDLQSATESDQVVKPPHHHLCVNECISSTHTGDCTGPSQVLLHHRNWGESRHPHCTMCILGTMCTFQPNKLRHILKVASW